MADTNIVDIPSPLSSQGNSNDDDPAPSSSALTIDPRSAMAVPAPDLEALGIGVGVMDQDLLEREIMAKVCFVPGLIIVTGRLKMLNCLAIIIFVMIKVDKAIANKEDELDNRRLVKAKKEIRSVPPRITFSIAYFLWVNYHSGV